MGWRDIFGPSREEIWRQLCQEIGGDFIDGGFWKGDKVQVRSGVWTITLDIYTVSAGHAHIPFTRMRAPFVSRDGLRFLLYRKGLWSELGKMLGMQDLETGQSARFDEDFIIKGNDEAKIRSLFANPEVRRLIEEQPEIRLELKDDEGTFGKIFPEGVDELVFTASGEIKDVARLKKLYDLFAEVLDQLTRIDSAAQTDPGVRL